MEERENERIPGNRSFYVITFIIGFILCLSGALMMAFDIGNIPARLTFGILGIILITTTSMRKSSGMRDH